MRQSALNTQMAYTAPPQQVVWADDAGNSDKSKPWQRPDVRPELLEFVTTTGSEFLDADALPFLHERHTSSGVSGLVAVGYFSAPGGKSGPERSLVTRVWSPGTGDSDPQVLRRDRPSSVKLFDKLQKNDSLRLYAGQPDPNDPSHFTISYEVNGTGGVIDGWLKDDDSVKLELRDGRGM